MHWFLEFNIFLFFSGTLAYYLIHNRGVHSVNRWLFLSLPLLFFGLSYFQPVYETAQNIAVVTLPTVDLSLPLETSQSLFNNLWLAYIAGASVMTVFISKAIISIFRLKGSAEKVTIGDKTIYVGDTTASFFGWIFISKGISRNEWELAIEHEYAHARQLHSFDRIIVSLFQIVLWFNPAIYLLKKAIIENHEYLADESVLKSNDKKTYGKFLLAQKMRSHQPTYHLTSNMSNLKLRIMKMNQRKKSALFAYLLVPALALGSLSFTYIETTSESQVTSRTEMTNNPVEDPDVFPSFKGGAEKMMTYLSTEIKYPKVAAESNVQGKVFVSMIIAEDGKVTSVEAVKSPDESLAKEAVRVVSSMPAWNPGEKDGKKVKVKMVLPIKFALPQE